MQADAQLTREPAKPNRSPGIESAVLFAMRRGGELMNQEEPRSRPVSFTPPFVPESREGEDSLRDRVSRARRAREAAADRVARRYAEIRPVKRVWRTDKTIRRSRRPRVL